VERKKLEKGEKTAGVTVFLIPFFLSFGGQNGSAERHARDSLHLV